ncbi:MAG: aminoglycoside phosphotransferase family protein [Nitrospinaceae bacterium]
MTRTPTFDDPNSPARFGKDFLLEFLPSIVRSPVREVVCDSLAGDASDRSYFRVSFKKAPAEEDHASVIVMQLKEPTGASETDFTRILNFLRGLDLPVPELYYYDSVKGLLFLEDCGRATLEDRVRGHPGETRTYYRKAVELLARLHGRATQNAAPDCPAFHRRFDVDKLMWELDFMLTHYVGGLNGCLPNADATGEIRRHFQSLCETLAAQEPCFTHRDYHSRNLIVQNGRLRILDFQDARMGPCQYDLVSLLKDSYVRLENDFRREMIDLFIDLKERQVDRRVDRQEFYRIFDWMSVQRNLKAVGTFAYQSVVNGNDRYLEYIPPTLDYVRQTLEDRSELASLGDILKKYLPGLNTQIRGKGFPRP